MPPGSREIELQIYGMFGSGFTRTINIILDDVNEEVYIPQSTDMNLRCSGPNILWSHPNVLKNEYDPLNDTSITIEFEEDLSGCNNTPSPNTVLFTLTKMP